MNREILFRGKRVDNGEWVEGCYVYGGANHYIVVRNGLSNQYNEVIPETVGQFTGLDDKNGKKIFEGDIVDPEYLIDVHRGIIVYDEGICGYCVEVVIGAGGTILLETDEWEVRGNIHDNPELLSSVEEGA